MDRWSKQDRAVREKLEKNSYRGQRADVVRALVRTMWCFNEARQAP